MSSHLDISKYYSSCLPVRKFQSNRQSLNKLNPLQCDSMYSYVQRLNSWWLDWYCLHFCPSSVPAFRSRNVVIPQSNATADNAIESTAIFFFIDQFGTDTYQPSIGLRTQACRGGNCNSAQASCTPNWDTSVVESSLFTGSSHDPQLLHELQKKPWEGVIPTT